MAERRSLGREILSQEYALVFAGRAWNRLINRALSSVFLIAISLLSDSPSRLEQQLKFGLIASGALIVVIGWVFELHYDSQRLGVLRRTLYMRDRSAEYSQAWEDRFVAYRSRIVEFTLFRIFAFAEPGLWAGLIAIMLWVRTNWRG